MQTILKKNYNVHIWTITLPLDCNSKNEHGILATTQGICYDL